MFERLAITAVGVAATVVLTVGLVAAGFTPRSAEPDAAIDAALLAAAQASADPSADPTLEPEIVYIKPAPTPRTVVVERRTTTRDVSSGQGSSDTRPVRLVRGDDDDDRWEREDREDHDRHEERDDEHERDDD
jgi:hypothetical protein